MLPLDVTKEADNDLMIVSEKHQLLTNFIVSLLSNN